MPDKIEIKLPCRTSGGFFPEIVCKDGFKLSVQTSDRHHCCPRTLDFFKLALYSDVEVGFPSTYEELLVPFADNPCSLAKTVYSHVPLEVVREIIRKHGGTIC